MPARPGIEAWPDDSRRSLVEVDEEVATCEPSCHTYDLSDDTWLDQTRGRNQKMHGGRGLISLLLALLSAFAIVAAAGFGTPAYRDSESPAQVVPIGYRVALDTATASAFHANPATGRVDVYKSEQRGFSSAGSVVVGQTPSALVFDQVRERLLVADPAAKAVHAITRSPSGVWTTVTSTPLPFAPAAVALNLSDGSVFATETAPTAGDAAPPATRSATLTPTAAGYTIALGNGFLRIRSTTSNTEFCLGTCTNVAVGADGVNGADGEQGGVGYCIGTCTNVATGGRGGASTTTDANGDLVTLGGRGGNGGQGYCIGRCINVASGGAGGDATATGTTTLSEEWSVPRGQSAEARGGSGGHGGRGICRGSCTDISAGGTGGTATALGADGLDGVPSDDYSAAYGGRGDNATAFGGLGGGSGWGTCNDTYCSPGPASDGTSSAIGGRGGAGADRSGDGYVIGGSGGSGGWATASGDGATSVGGDGGRGGNATSNGNQPDQTYVQGGYAGHGGGSSIWGVDTYANTQAGTTTGGHGGAGGAATGPAAVATGGHGGYGGSAGAGGQRPGSVTATGGPGGRGGDAENCDGEAHGGDGGNGGGLGLWGAGATGVSGNGGDGGTANGPDPKGGNGGPSGEIYQNDAGATGRTGEPGQDGSPSASESAD